MATTTSTTYLSPTVSPTLNRQRTTPNTNARPHSLSTPIYQPKWAPLHRRFRSPLALHNSDLIPKQFPAENLQNASMENYGNAPELVYGLRPSEMNMFMSEGGLFRRQQEETDEEEEEIISSARDSSIIRAIGRRGIKIPSGRGRKMRGPPPDEPSSLMRARIIMLEKAIYETVAETIFSQIVALNKLSTSKPIYLYIYSIGTEAGVGNLYGYHTDAYAIADAMSESIAKVYTVNIGEACGQAAMLLSLGEKGHRLIRPNARTQLYLPSTYPTSDIASELWDQARELELETEIFLKLLAGSTGKSKEEIAEDLKRPRNFSAEEAIAYGIADKIAEKTDVMYDKRTIDLLRAKTNASNIAKSASSKRFLGIR